MMYTSVMFLNPQSLRDSPLQGACGPARTGRLCRLVNQERKILASFTNLQIINNLFVTLRGKNKLFFASGEVLYCYETPVWTSER